MAEHWVASRLFGCNKYLHSIVSHPNGGAQPPGGFRSSTKLDLKCCKYETHNYWSLDSLVGWSGSREALLPPRPLRTPRATFTARGSSTGKPCFTRAGK